MRFETICVVGLGYIGLPTAAVLASRGQRVIGVDVNPTVVETINRGDVHIVEPDLDLAVRSAVASGLLTATVTPQAADAFLIAVPTPFGPNHEPDVSYVRSAAEAIAPVLKRGDLVVLESTSPVGTTELVAEWLSAKRPDLTFPQAAGADSDVRVAHCPERVLPGKVLRELVANDRVVGGLTTRCAEAAVGLYKSFVEGECMITDARTAEMCKLTENSFRDVNIAFANELSLICHNLKINVWELIRLANRHPRVNILQPGPGVGGHCIAVDPWFIVASSPDEARLIRTARTVNDHKPRWVLEQVEKARLASTRARPTIACLGLAFKPNIDDLRESPSLAITEALAAQGTWRVLVAEPHIDTLPRSLSAAAELVDSATAIAQADVVLLLVDHDQFKAIDRASLAARTVIDTRGLWQLDIDAQGRSHA